MLEVGVFFAVEAPVLDEYYRELRQNVSQQCEAQTGAESDDRPTRNGRAVFLSEQSKETSEGGRAIL
jgi:hypothetical protein